VGRLALTRRGHKKCNTYLYDSVPNEVPKARSRKLYVQRQLGNIAEGVNEYGCIGPSSEDWVDSLSVQAYHANSSLQLWDWIGATGHTDQHVFQPPPQRIRTPVTHRGRLPLGHKYSASAKVGTKLFSPLRSTRLKPPPFHNQPRKSLSRGLFALLVGFLQTFL